MRKITPCLLVAVLCSCGTALPGTKSCEVLPKYSTKMHKGQNGVRYFPSAFGKPSLVCNFKGYPECFPIISKIEADWFPKHWQAANEPSLYELSTAKDRAIQSTIRFTYLPTFHHPVIVRIETSKDETRLIARELSGQGGYEPGQVSREVNRVLTPSERRQLSETLKATGVLKLQSTTCDFGLDGSQWIFESIDGETYSYVNRFSPKRGPMRKFGLFMIRLTGWQITEIY